ncbi:MAG: glycosyltransferase family 39 protein [Anaerolineales bacterium]
MALNAKGNNRIGWVFPILLLVFSYLLHLPSSPHVAPMGADSGIFAYGAEQMLDGKLLYRDVWDHKPPAVFYVNALAILIGGSTPWSIWWLGVVWVAMVSIAFFFLLRLLTGQVYAAVGALILLASILYPAFYLDGNFSEVYSLLPQLLILFVAYAYFRSSKKKWIFILGLLTAIIMLFKQTYIATGLAAFIVILVFRWREGGWRSVGSALVSFISGLLLPILSVIIFWWTKGAWSDFIDATLLFNLDYAQAGLSFRNLYATFRTLVVLQPMSAIVLLCLSGLVLFFVDCVIPGAREEKEEASGSEESGRSCVSFESRQSAWTAACLYLAVPIEICFLFLSGRNFGHYFLTPLPVFVGGATLALSHAIPSLSTRIQRSKSVSAAWTALMIMLLVAWGVDVSAKVLPSVEQLRDVEVTFQGEVPLQPVRKFIVENSTTDDSVLVWGVHPALNFITNRRSPTRFLNPIALLYPTRAQDSKLSIFITDLENDPPELILAHVEYAAFLTHMDASGEEFCPGCSSGALAKLGDFYGIVSTGYCQTERIGDWLIFVRVSSE